MAKWRRELISQPEPYPASSVTLATASGGEPQRLTACTPTHRVQVMCELFGGVVLPERKLKYLYEQPLHLLPEAALKGDVRNKVRWRAERRGEGVL